MPRRPSAAAGAAVLTIVLALLPTTPAGAFGSVTVGKRPEKPAFAPSWAATARTRPRPTPTSCASAGRITRTRPARRGGTTSVCCGRALRRRVFERSPARRTDRRRSRRSRTRRRCAPGSGTARRTRPVSIAATAATSCSTPRRRFPGTAGTTASRATASKPAGPFVDRSKGPWLCMDKRGGVIDPSPFVDARGRAWLYVKTYDLVERGPQPARIWAIRLGHDGRTRVSPPQPILSQSELSRPYQTVENPQMLLVGSTYVLLYSRGLVDLAQLPPGLRDLFRAGRWLPPGEGRIPPVVRTCAWAGRRHDLPGPERSTVPRVPRLARRVAVHRRQRTLRPQAVRCTRETLLTPRRRVRGSRAASQYAFLRVRRTGHDG